MYIAAAGAHVQSERLRVLSNNLANVDTPGFKHEMAVFQARHAEAIERGEDQAGSGSINDIGGGVNLAGTTTSFSQGNLQATHIETDMAIDGDGFFQVEKDGQQFLTRAGNFHVDTTGRLMTRQGHAVLAADGKPIALDPTLPWQLFENGVIDQEGDQIPLGLVKPQSLGDLAKAGENLFSPLAEVSPVPTGERRVLQGFLEQSTVKPALQMMELIETSRAYEANIKMIQNQDHVIGSLLSRMLRS
jgi:flagellar basal-body rod protein FlgF/flagellar basal-body rod protein FlgG